MVKKTQRIEGKNPTYFFAFSHPDCFLPYMMLKKTNQHYRHLFGPFYFGKAYTHPKKRLGT